MNPVKIFSSRKLKPAFHATAASLNYILVEDNLISVAFRMDRNTEDKIAAALKSDCQTYVFTSANGVMAFKAMLEQLGQSFMQKNIFSLCGKTKETLEKEFPQNNFFADAKNARELAGFILGQGINEVIFICGNMRRDTLPVLLENAGIICKEMIIYETKELVKKLDDDFDALLFFSPSAVSSFFKLNRPGNKTVCFAIGETTAQSLRDMNMEKVYMSPIPSEESMLDTLKKYYQKQKNDQD